MNIEDANRPERAWLLVACPERWPGIVRDRSFGLKGRKRAPASLKYAKPGEPCIVFVSEKQIFAGWGKITGGYYYDMDNEFPHRIRLEVTLDFAKSVPIRSMINELRFIKNTTNWQAYFRKGIKSISLSDYQVIKAELEARPTSAETQPESQQGEEEALEPRTIVLHLSDIDSHSNAEGALLELGNLLGFDTYVTADDRNKEFRGKLLSKTATLQEMPEDCIPPGIKNTVRHIDVIWFEEKFPRYCIEVEHSTDITHGLLRLYRLKELKTSFMVVAPTGAQDKFEREVKKAPFDSIRDSFRFNSYDDLTRFLAVAREFVGEKQNFLG